SIFRWFHLPALTTLDLRTGSNFSWKYSNISYKSLRSLSFDGEATKLIEFLQNTPSLVSLEAVASLPLIHSLTIQEKPHIPLVPTLERLIIHPQPPPGFCIDSVAFLLMLKSRTGDDKPQYISPLRYIEVTEPKDGHILTWSPRLDNYLSSLERSDCV